MPDRGCPMSDRKQRRERPPCPHELLGQRRTMKPEVWNDHGTWSVVQDETCLFPAWKTTPTRLRQRLQEGRIGYWRCRIWIAFHAGVVEAEAREDEHTTTASRSVDPTYFMRRLGIFINKDGGIEPLPLSKPDATKDMRAVGLDV